MCVRGEIDRYLLPPLLSFPGANRENLSFFLTPRDAEQAGFRPCKRCRPSEESREERERALVTAACRRMEAAEETPSLSKLAAQAEMSRYHFHRLFKKIVGVTPRSYAATLRHIRLQDKLRSGSRVTEALYASGFNASSRFYEEAPDILGMKPSTYRKGGPGESIWHAARQCSLGYVLVAATDKGVCAILLGDDPASLLDDLKSRFPQANLTAPGPAFAGWVESVVRWIDEPNPRKGPELPLDIRGTAFQRRVWEALREIPAGKTMSYAELAKRLGNGRAVRAVAGACSANTLAVAIPCHRVIASNGKLSGYRWGVERKRRLLNREQK
ncbi:MAG: bifunctional DNA-binding transcriptional regulator/O6-methylguanine-DNA methyltransferase Ada [Terriglobia bacterium]